VVFIDGDAWTIGAHLEQLQDLAPRPALIGYCPPDSPNQPYGARLNTLDLLLCPTAFGVRELRAGGYTGEAHVVPYGVNRTLYHPHDQRESRRAWGFPEDAVIFGRGDRNAKRKRHDETLRIFKRYVEEIDPEAYLHLHCAPKDVGWDLPQLVNYYGLKDRVFFTGQDLAAHTMIDEAQLPSLFSCWTAHWSCTMGEGFGLVALDSAACGVPQVLPNWSAYGEWMRDGARLVAIDRVLATDGGINTIGTLVDEDDCLAALRDVATAPDYWAKKALDVATRPCYDWDNVTATILAHTARVLAKKEETR
jgi:glycosyltransferase involved in cell wall biosynthesis